MNTKGQMGRKRKSLLLTGASKENENESDSFNPRNINNITKVIMENPKLTVKDYNKLFGANLSVQEFSQYRKSLLRITDRLKGGKD